MAVVSPETSHNISSDFFTREVYDHAPWFGGLSEHGVSMRFKFWDDENGNHTESAPYIEWTGEPLETKQLNNLVGGTYYELADDSGRSRLNGRKALQMGLVIEQHAPSHRRMIQAMEEYNEIPCRYKDERLKKAEEANDNDDVHRFDGLSPLNYISHLHDPDWVNGLLYLDFSRVGTTGIHFSEQLILRTPNKLLADAILKEFFGEQPGNQEEAYKKLVALIGQPTLQSSRTPAALHLPVRTQTPLQWANSN